MNSIATDIFFPLLQYIYTSLTLATKILALILISENGKLADDLLHVSQPPSPKETIGERSQRAFLRFFLSGRAAATLASNRECRGMFVLKEAK